MMVAQITKWGNTQGIELCSDMLKRLDVKAGDEVNVKVLNNTIVILPKFKKDLDWYLDSCDDEYEPLEWDEFDAPVGRELL